MLETGKDPIRPLYYSKIELQPVDKRIYEPTIPWIEKFVENAVPVSQKLVELGVRKRISILGEVGKLWQETLPYIEEKLIPVISRSTGYSPENIRVDLEFIHHVFNENNLMRLLDTGLIGGWRSLDQPVEVDDGEFLWNRPVGSSLIISSGNTVIPAALPLVASLATGNVTILRPSSANYSVIAELYKAFSKVHEDKVDGAEEMMSALLISYFAHDSKALDYILTKTRIGVVNYWGGDPGRKVIIEKISRNTFHPRLVINGPLTGIALVDEDSASDELARKLAWDIVIYDQQLCSSPSYVIFIGSTNKALEFAKVLGKFLDEVGALFPKKVGEGELYNLISMRKRLEVEGAYVLYSKNLENPWTIAVTSSWRRFNNNPYQFKNDWGFRKRFAEILVVENIGDLKTIISSLMEELANQGVDKFQTVAMSLNDKNYASAISALSLFGVYRIVPIGESFLRTPVEPYDGEFLPRYFTYSLYIRRKGKLLNIIKFSSGRTN
ncbi:MAG: aldehyde dehydrogenase family protein [Thermosphaera sp.]